MALEIERRFLIKNDNWKKFITKKIFIEQGYLSKSLGDWIIRIRFTGKDYKIALKKHIESFTNFEFEYSIPSKDGEIIMSNLSNTFKKEIDSISKIPLELNSKNYNKFCQEILSNNGNLFLMGIGKSGNIAEKICSTLSSTGTPAIYINAAEASHGDLGMLTKKDLLIVFSFSGETEEILKILPSCKKKVKNILSVTGNKKSTLSNNSKISITLKIDEEACPMDLAPTTSSTSMLLLGDAIAISLLEAKNFSPKDSI